MLLEMHVFERFYAIVRGTKEPSHREGEFLLTEILKNRKRSSRQAKEIIK